MQTSCRLVWLIPVLLAFLACAVAGCAPSRWQLLSPPQDEGRPAGARGLSSELRAALSVNEHFPEQVDSLVANADPGWVADVEKELIATGAWVGADGKCRDGGGREIYLWIWPPGPGCQRPEAELHQERERLQRALNEAKQRYRVLELPWGGPSPP